MDPASMEREEGCRRNPSDDDACGTPFPVPAVVLVPPGASFNGTLVHSWLAWTKVECSPTVLRLELKLRSELRLRLMLRLLLLSLLRDRDRPVLPLRTGMLLLLGAVFAVLFRDRLPSTESVRSMFFIYPVTLRLSLDGRLVPLRLVPLRLDRRLDGRLPLVRRVSCEAGVREEMSDTAEPSPSSSSSVSSVRVTCRGFCGTQVSCALVVHAVSCAADWAARRARARALVSPSSTFLLLGSAFLFTAAEARWSAADRWARSWALVRVRELVLIVYSFFLNTNR